MCQFLLMITNIFPCIMDENDFMITHNLQDKTGGECIKFKDDFKVKEYEEFIKREG